MSSCRNWFCSVSQHSKNLWKPSRSEVPFLFAGERETDMAFCDSQKEENTLHPEVPRLPTKIAQTRLDQFGCAFGCLPSPGVNLLLDL